MHQATCWQFRVHEIEPDPDRSSEFPRKTDCKPITEQWEIYRRDCSARSPAGPLGEGLGALGASCQHPRHVSQCSSNIYMSSLKPVPGIWSCLNDSLKLFGWNYLQNWGMNSKGCEWHPPGLQAPALTGGDREAKRCAQGKPPVWGRRAGAASEAPSVETEGRLPGVCSAFHCPLSTS
ncbi:hypothetical protein HJG60_008068 [Phyllostomus discolor]|uniref:Uncharacterized protein n=1 Tax=Phyllostomus discolor TaxID=89673 RepID=A0A834BK48_9CHIR|nr:hypothetical protein HJG60_008068 [Phyllostomus discolor]